MAPGNVGRIANVAPDGYHCASRAPPARSSGTCLPFQCSEKLLNFIVAEVIRHHERIAEEAGGKS
ncbi:hypothetical protein GA0115257_111621 [Streptomyces sp. LcepLS]|nr:hypothetical protein GA0115257_111621 [Streptomyces sp. LcepLS]